MSSATLPTVHYFTDLLCVWAWIAQPRVAEAQAQFGDRIRLEQRYLDVFGSAHDKILSRWGQSDGFESFAAHIQEGAAAHDHARLHPDLWTRVRPTSSWPAHLMIKAVTRAAGSSLADEYAAQLRVAFFTRGEDISDDDVLRECLETLTLPVPEIERELFSGQAHADLAADMRAAAAARISGSPTWSLNEGRQVLFGNVGYRVIRANLEEFLGEETSGASWC
ncbi:MAG: DsbA family protein [Xanthomonadales bacterium]|jgi:predicted DsbA family dithiol-disulfide isomerase|nr:DsbA family protein [Xanthomonadales bacterium]